MGKNMKKPYFLLEAEVVTFDEDVITSSVGTSVPSVGTSFPVDWMGMEG